MLFCPADRPDRHRKAATAADGVILDLGRKRRMPLPPASPSRCCGMPVGSCRDGFGMTGAGVSARS